MKVNNVLLVLTLVLLLISVVGTFTLMNKIALMDAPGSPDSIGTKQVGVVGLEIVPDKPELRSTEGRVSLEILPSE